MFFAVIELYILNVTFDIIPSSRETVLRVELINNRGRAARFKKFPCRAANFDNPPLASVRAVFTAEGTIVN